VTINAPIRQPHETRRIEALALESQMPLDTVIDLYEDECAKLELAARIKGFLPIFALRNLRDRLSQLGVPR